jgi:hypothetical protein
LFGIKILTWGSETSFIGGLIKGIDSSSNTGHISIQIVLPRNTETKFLIKKYCRHNDPDQEIPYKKKEIFVPSSDPMKPAISEKVYVVTWSWHPATAGYYLEDDINEDRISGRKNVAKSLDLEKMKRFGITPEFRSRGSGTITLGINRILHKYNLESIKTSLELDVSWINSYIQKEYDNKILISTNSELRLLKKKLIKDIQSSKKGKIKLKPSTLVMFKNLMPHIKLDKMFPKASQDIGEIEHNVSLIENSIDFKINLNKSTIKLNKSFLKKKNKKIFKEIEEKIEELEEYNEKIGKHLKKLKKYSMDDEKYHSLIKKIIKDVKNDNFLSLAQSYFPGIDLSKEKFETKDFKSNGRLDYNNFFLLVNATIEENKKDIKAAELDEKLITKLLSSENSYSGGAPPDHSMFMPLDSGTSIGLNAEEMLKKMREITKVKFFNLYSYNCSNSVGEIIKAGITDKKSRKLFKPNFLGKYSSPQIIKTQMVNLQKRMFPSRTSKTSLVDKIKKWFASRNKPTVHKKPDILNELGEHAKIIKSKNVLEAIVRAEKHIKENPKNIVVFENETQKLLNHYFDKSRLLKTLGSEHSKKLSDRLYAIQKETFKRLNDFKDTKQKTVNTHRKSF